MHPLPRAYDHRFHAGNVGDVWKHAALMAWLEAWTAPRRAIIETHAGAGRYPLASTGEWTEGVGRVVDVGEIVCATKYLTEARRAVTSRSYPGSPALTRQLLGPDDRLILHELAPEPARELRTLMAVDTRASVREGDGLASIEEALASVPEHEVLVVIDPPYADRAEWGAVAPAIGRALARAPGARFLLWYPVKSHARPNAMIAELGKVTAGVALELITAPLTLQKNRLNGSGLVLVGAPEGLVPTLAGLAAWLGPRLSVGDGFWQTRGLSWGRSGP